MLRKLYALNFVLLITHQVEAAWSVITPVLEAWEATAPNDFPNYRASTWGPEAAEVLIAQDGRSWQEPMLEDSGDGQECVQ